MRIFNFVVLSVITAPHNVPTPHNSQTHLPIVSLNVSNWIDAQKTSQGKKGGPLRGGGGPTPPPGKP